MLNKTQIVSLCFLLLCCHSLSWSVPFMTEWQSKKAYDQFQEGKYDEAATLYNSAAEKADEKLKPSLVFNGATSEAQAGKTTQSLEAFSQIYSANNPELNTAARYNMGVCLATSESLAIESSISEGKRIVSDPSIQALANTDKSTTLTEEQKGAMAQASEQVKNTLNAVTQSSSNNKIIAKAWREALIESPGESDSQHNAEVTALTQNQLETLQNQLEELLKKLQPPPQSNNQNQQQNQQQQDQQQNQQDQKDQQNNNDSKNQEQNENKQDKKESEQEKQKQQDQNKADDSQQQNQQDKQDKQKEQESKKNDEKQNQDQQSPENKQDQQQKPDKQNGSSGNDKDKQPKPVKVGEMSEHDVQRLLNSLPDNNEEILGRLLNAKTNTKNDVEKDW